MDAVGKSTDISACAAVGQQTADVQARQPGSCSMEAVHEQKSACTPVSKHVLPLARRYKGFSTTVENQNEKLYCQYGDVETGLASV